MLPFNGDTYFTTDSNQCEKFLKIDYFRTKLFFTVVGVLQEKRSLNSNGIDPCETVCLSLGGCDHCGKLAQ